MPRPIFLLNRFPGENNPKPILLPRRDIEWEGKAVFNPAIATMDTRYVMLYRTYPSELKETEPRHYRPGYKLTNNISYIGKAISNDGINFEKKFEKPIIEPSEVYDKYGCEDPRITKFEDFFYITYTAIDAPLWEKEVNPNIRIAIARTKDFEKIEKLGIVGPSVKSKAACIWPERIGGQIGFAYTENADSTNSSVKIKYFKDIEDILTCTKWDDGQVLLNSEPWLHRGPELGAVPIKTDTGWLMIYSSESMTDTWSVSAALFDINNPERMIGRTKGFILESATDYERNGFVPNVVFPSGALVVKDEVWVYYGAADTVIGMAKGNYNELIKSMMVTGL